jgi:hypothetical protein
MASKHGEQAWTPVSGPVVRRLIDWQDERIGEENFA